MKKVMLGACILVLLICLFPPRIGFPEGGKGRWDVSRTFLFSDDHRYRMGTDHGGPGDAPKGMYVYAQIDAGQLLGEVFSLLAFAGIILIVMSWKEHKPQTEQTD